MQLIILKYIDNISNKIVKMHSININLCKKVIVIL